MAHLNRRGFLGALASALVLDPERLLWVPRKKLISIPALPSCYSIDEMNTLMIQWAREYNKQFADSFFRESPFLLAFRDDRIDGGVVYDPLIYPKPYREQKCTTNAS